MFYTLLNVYLLDKSPEDPDIVSKRSAAIRSTSDSAAVHVKQILSYARNDSVLLNSVELNQCVQSSCQMVSSMIPATIELCFVPHEEKICVNWNETQIQQILINLINNARYALKNIENPSIKLEISIIDNTDMLMQANYAMTDEKYVCLSVQDNGCGMPEDIMNQIFNPFFTTKDSDEGTGLGLSMAYGAIKQAGGSMMVESELGKGTIFRICFPMTAATDELDMA